MGLYLLFFIVSFPVTALVYQHSILYNSPHFYTPVVLVVYLLATCISGLFSSHWCINVFGVLAFILAIVAALVSITTLVSVWCFYAAVLSLLVYLHFSGSMQACRHLLPPRLKHQSPWLRRACGFSTGLTASSLASTMSVTALVTVPSCNGSAGSRPFLPADESWRFRSGNCRSGISRRAATSA